MRKVNTAKTCDFLEAFQKGYTLTSVPPIFSFELKGVPGRSRIILFANIAAEKIEKKGDSARFSNGEDKFPIRYHLQQDPTITVAVRNDPTKNQPGNVFLLNIPRYDPGEIPAIMNNIIEQFPSNLGNQKIAFIMRQSKLLGMPITIEHLLEQGYEGTTSQVDTVFLNTGHVEEPPKVFVLN